AVQTDDMRIYFKLMKYFKGTRLVTRFFALDQEIPMEKYDLIITTKEKFPDGSKVMQIDKGRVDPEITTIALSLIARKNSPRFKLVTIGIDPGETIGIAAICDGMLLNAKTVRLEDLIKEIKDYMITFPSEQIKIKIGNKPPSMSNIIFNKIFSKIGNNDNISLEVVDEKFTTPKKSDSVLSLSPDEIAAFSIANRNGKKQSNIVRVEITKGRMKEIQNWSRKKSKNRISLDYRLAEAVALGELSLTEAISIKESQLKTKKKGE
ncbi:MAG: hypothetical protein ACTSPV_06105, partial [Candidatus Hodarchaeales archaeon]